MGDWLEISVGMLLLVAGIIVGAAAVKTQYQGFTCTQQQAVSDTMPQESECVQWTKGE